MSVDPGRRGDRQDWRPVLVVRFAAEAPRSPPSVRRQYAVQPRRAPRQWPAAIDASEPLGDAGNPLSTDPQTDAE